MEILIPTVNQMAFLFLLIGIGFLLTKLKVVSPEGPKLLSQLENNVFVPCLVLGTFMNNFTLKSIDTAGIYLLVGSIIILSAALLSVALARFFTKDADERKVYTYGLCFANFGFMGNAVVSALFPDAFMNYLIFTLPYTFMIYIWAVPYLLIPAGEKRGGLKSTLLRFVNPMFVAMLVGIALGLLALPIPTFFKTSVSTLGDCMSPIAMLLTGMTIARINVREVFKKIPIYAVSIVRLIVIPLAAIAVLTLADLPFELELCIICSLSMPLGLNTVVIPGAYGKDTTLAAGMALISHLLGAATIPLIFLLFNTVAS